MEIVVGTSGFSYREWLGSFYPEKLPAAAMLRYYAERYPTVEINSSFYRVPAPSTLARWSQEVPPGFRFVLKAPRRITHQGSVESVVGSIEYFLRVTDALGDRRGPLLFQFPPYLPKDLRRLDAFLSRIAGLAPAAFELRHPSWHDAEVDAALRAAGAALCIADTDERPLREGTPLPATAAWGYLRLRRTDYREPDLAAWLQRILDQPWQQAFVFFKHEEKATGPKLAARLLQLVAAAQRERLRGG